MASSPCTGPAPIELSYFTAVFSIVLGVVTTVGNATIIAAVVRDPYRTLRSPFMYFLINLAVSDLLNGCVTLPLSVVVHFKEAADTKEAWQGTAIRMAYFVSSTASSLSLLALCVDRYCSVTWPIRYRAYASYGKCAAASAGVWVLSFGLPLLYFAVGYMNYLMVYAHSSVFAVFFFMVFTYVKVYKNLRRQAAVLRAARRTTDPDSGDDHVERQSVKTEKKVTRAFLLILAMFVACYLPVIVMIYILKFCQQCNCILRHSLRDFAFLLVVSNSAINPFVCTLRLKSFRKAVSHVLTCQAKHSKYDLNRMRTKTLESIVQEGQGS